MTFTITVSGSYTRNEIPPRCRKARPVTHDTTTTVPVDTVSSEEAPVAFRVTGITGPDGPEPPVSEIRTHRGKLYAPFTPTYQQSDPTIPGGSRFPSELVIYPRGQDPSSAEEYAHAVQAEFAAFLIIDGTAWKEAPEPGYLVVTFGMGGINGSTGLMVSSRADHGTLFRADEFEAARDYAAEVSRNRGDREDRYTPVEAESYRRIEVVIPEAVTLVTVPPTPKEVRDLRFDYSIARDELSRANTPDEETELFAEICRLRESIIGTGHTPVGSDASPYEARHEQED